MKKAVLALIFLSATTAFASDVVSLNEGDSVVRTKVTQISPSEVEVLHYGVVCPTLTNIGYQHHLMSFSSQQQLTLNTVDVNKMIYANIGVETLIDGVKYMCVSNHEE